MRLRIRYALIAIIVLLLAIYGLRGLREGVTSFVDVGSSSREVKGGKRVGFRGGRTVISYAAQSATDLNVD